MDRRHAVYAGVFLWAWMASLSAQASIVTVNVLTDTASAVCPTTCSFRAALAAAQPADEIRFSGPGVIALSTGLGPLVVDKSLTITGPGPSAFDLVVQGANAIRILEVNAGVTASVSRVAFELGNAGTDNGGAIRNRGSLTLTEVYIRDSRAAAGGGIYNEGGSLALADTTVDQNTAGIGGGIASVSGAVSLSRSLLSRNLATQTSTSSGGGGLLIFGTPAALANILTNTTIANNFSAGAGGGIVAFSPVAFTHCTVSGNAAADTGGIATTVPGSTTLRATIVSGNTGAGCAAPGSTIFASSGDNLSSDGTCVLTNATLNDRNNTDPAFDGGLQDNGGPTQTFALQITSPAVNGVTHTTCPPPATDQRGVVRPVGVRCDIGAFERDPAPVSLQGFSVN
jgi:hypothetical protein